MGRPGIGASVHPTPYPAGLQRQHGPDWVQDLEMGPLVYRDRKGIRRRGYTPRQNHLRIERCRMDGAKRNSSKLDAYTLMGCASPHPPLKLHCAIIYVVAYSPRFFRGFFPRGGGDVEGEGAVAGSRRRGCRCQIRQVAGGINWCGRRNTWDISEYIFRICKDNRPHTSYV